MTNSFPKLHNAAWPGLVGKEEGTENPPIALDRMLDFTAAADVGGVKFDGIDLFLFDPHTSIDADDAELEALAEKVTSRGLVIGSLVAPVWEPTGGGSAMGTEEERTRFLTQVRKACGIGKRLRDMGVRPYGLIRIDSACGVEPWSADPEAGQAAIADTFRKAADIAEEHGERLAAEGEICWGGMHSWKRMTQLLEMVDRPGVVGFQADMAHTLLYTMGYNAPEDRILPDAYDWQDQSELDKAMQVKLGGVHGGGVHGLHPSPNSPTWAIESSLCNRPPERLNPLYYAEHKQVFAVDTSTFAIRPAPRLDTVSTCR